jgi:hypothetical protein
MRQPLLLAFAVFFITFGSGGSADRALVSAATPVPASEKERIEQRHQQERLVPAASKGDPAKERPTVAVTNRPAPTGVLDVSVAPFPSSQFRATNRWNGFVGDNLVAVIAGGPPNSRVAKLAIITFDSEGLNALDVTWVELSDSPGRPRIATATQTNLLITTESGRWFAFDAASRRLSAIP